MNKIKLELYRKNNFQFLIVDKFDIPIDDEKLFSSAAADRFRSEKRRREEEINSLQEDGQNLVDQEDFSLFEIFLHLCDPRKKEKAKKRVSHERRRRVARLVDQILRFPRGKRGGDVVIGRVSNEVSTKYPRNCENCGRDVSRRKEEGS